MSASTRRYAHCKDDQVIWSNRETCEKNNYFCKCDQLVYLENCGIDDHMYKNAENPLEKIDELKKDIKECKTLCYTKEQRDQLYPKSIAWDTQVDLLFDNQSGYAVQIYWLDYSHNPVGIVKLENGKETNMNTFYTHPFGAWALDGKGNAIDNGSVMLEVGGEDFFTANKNNSDKRHLKITKKPCGAKSEDIFECAGCAVE